MVVYMRSKLGFSLIELMVVIAIVALLSTFSVPLYTTHVAKANLSKIVPVFNSFKTQVADFYVANGRYPTAVELKSDSVNSYIVNVGSELASKLELSGILYETSGNIFWFRAYTDMTNWVNNVGSDKVFAMKGTIDATGLMQVTCGSYSTGAYAIGIKYLPGNCLTLY